jgi:hypothetical protein
VRNGIAAAGTVTDRVSLDFLPCRTQDDARDKWKGRNLNGSTLGALRQRQNRSNETNGDIYTWSSGYIHRLDIHP